MQAIKRCINPKCTNHTTNGICYQCFSENWKPPKHRNIDIERVNLVMKSFDSAREQAQMDYKKRMAERALKRIREEKRTVIKCTFRNKKEFEMEGV